ncbi:hypothetical protein M569_01739, partial [Genlisea aurea]
YLGIEKGKIACHKSEGGRLIEELSQFFKPSIFASRAFRDEAFWQSQVNFGLPNPATEEKALFSKGANELRCHTPCLPKVPRVRVRRSRATAPEQIPHRQEDRRRPSQGTSRPTGKTGETREGNPIGSQKIHSTCSLPDFIFIIFDESGGEGISF